jgi:pimeloyl-ACP methyl ester carboxylesterase
MKNPSRKLIVFFMFLFILIGSNTGNAKNGKPSKKENAFTNIKGNKKSGDTNKPTISKSIPQISNPPISFEENKGQTDKSVKFLSRGKGFDLFLSANETVYTMPDAKCNQRHKDSKKQNSIPCRMLSLKMKMINANGDSLIQGIDETVTKTGYYLGNDSSKWLDGINNYRAVRYEKIYQGIDAVFRGAAQNLEYDFHIAPEADPHLIQLEFSGAKKIKFDSNGNLIFKFKGVELRHNKPVAYQIINGERREVSAKFISLGKNKIGFAVGEYDKTNELIIDPLVYATYLSDLGARSTEGIAIDSAGYIYTVSYGGASESNIILTKLDPGGTEKIRNLVIGGSDDDIGWAIDIDGSGNVYIGGQTSSLDFPMVNARQTVSSVRAGEYGNSGVEGFILKLNPSLNTFLYSTYHGATSARNGYDEDWVYSIDVDSSGNLYAVGATGGTDFPLVNGYRMTRNTTDFDAYLSKFSPTGELLYSTLFGSVQAYTWAFGNDVAVDNNGFAYLSGEISATSQMPVTPGAYKSGGTKGYVAKFNTNNSGSSSLVYATYTESTGQAIEIDQYGNAISIGSGNQYTAGYGVKLNSAGTAAIFKINIQGGVADIAINNAGNIYFAQAINVVENNQSSSDVKVVGYSPTGSLLDETVIKGERLDSPKGIALDSNNKICVVGYTTSKNFPTTEGSLQRNSHLDVYGNAPYQGFLVKVSFDSLPPLGNPLIFIPGTMGSELYRKETNEKYWAKWGSSFFYNSYLTLNSQSPYFLGNDAFEARDVWRKVRYDGQVLINFGNGSASTIPVGYEPTTVYDDLIKKLIATDDNGGHYIEYNIKQNPILRNTNGTCDLSQINNPEGKPNLFVFPYDFRKSNAESAVKLKQFIECVQAFYPDNKVDILGHSQGGIVARRYILDSVAAGQDSKVDKLITIASPWLGAPEAIYKMETGGDYLPDGFNSVLGVRDQLGFTLLTITPPTLKTLAEFFPSVHQLLPTRAYQNLSGASLKELGDVNGNSIHDESYSYEQTKNFLNNDFPRTLPGSNNEAFHDFPGQDNWSSDQSGVKYYHIVATKAGETTTTSVTVKIDEVCTSPDETGDRICGNIRNFSPTKGLGDGTVPRLSADRGYISEANRGLNAPNATIVHLDSPSQSENAKYEHNGVTKNPFAHAYILFWLGRQSNLTTNGLAIDSASKESLLPKSSPISQSNNAVSVEESYYLKILGIPNVQISDESGVHIVRDNEYTVNPVDGLLEYKVIGENALFLTFEPTKTYYVDFQVGNSPMTLEALKGINNQIPALAVRFKDISLPTGVKARLTLTAQNVESLRYDSDNNGSFDTVVNPSVVLNGTNANDTKPPTAEIDLTQEGTDVTLAITGQDAVSGVGQIRYSLDGIHFTQYTSPVILNSTSNLIKVFAFVDDNAGNRSGLYTKEFFRFSDITITNVALAANGGVASASSELSGAFVTIDGVRNWATTGAWKDATADVYPDWLQVDFSGSKTIGEIDVYAVKDDFGNATDPTESETFSVYGITNFDVQYWNGVDWVTVPNGNVVNNNKVITKLVFPGITTTKIRVVVNNAQSSYSRIVELQAWGYSSTPPTPTPTVTPTPIANTTPTPTPVTTPTPTPTFTPTPIASPTPSSNRINVALSNNGGVASASSSLSGAFVAIDGVRNWATTGAWKDATADVYPDWLQVDFSGSKTIGEIDVYAVKDDFGNATDPTEFETFSVYGITNFEVQYWTGSTWATVPGGYIGNTNRVITKVVFSPITTTRIRVVVNNAQASYSRIVELEAWGN